MNHWKEDNHVLLLLFKFHMKIPYLFIFTVLLFSCNGPDPIVDQDNYDRTVLLENLTKNVITPSIESFQIALLDLNNAADSFNSIQNQTNFSKLKKSWEQAYIKWQHVEMYEIGKAEELDFAKSMNTYPTNTTIINNNINSAQYNLSDATWPSWSAQGLPAIDYMLYGLDNDSNSVLGYYSGNEGSKYLNYLNALIAQMILNTDEVQNYWAINADAFINSPGNTANSSLNLLTNDFIYYFEKGLRANKIGIPCGRWDNYQPYEKGVEAYYRKNLSKRLSLESLNACKKFFSGTHHVNNQNGESYIDYLLYKSGNNNLSENIINQMNESELALENLNDDFVQQLSSDNLPMMEAYDELQSVVVLLKTDLLINLSITVDYVDADGD